MSRKRKSVKNSIPDGFILRKILEAHPDRLDSKFLMAPSDTILCMSWSPDGKRLASGCIDQTIQLWDTQTGELLRILEGHSNIIWSVMWSPDGRMLASGSEDETIRLWNMWREDPP